MDRDGGGFVDISELSTYIIRPTVENIQNLKNFAKFFDPDFSIYSKVQNELIMIKPGSCKSDISLKIHVF